MNWTQTLVLAAAILFAGMSFSRATNPIGTYAVSAVPDGMRMRAYIVSPTGQLWHCHNQMTAPPACAVVTLP